MTESSYIDSLPAATHAVRVPRAALAALVWLVVAGNAAVIVWLWWHGGNAHPKTTGDLLTSIARITGLLSAYLALVQVLLLARLPFLERLLGFDRLTVWHRWNGHATIDLVIAHVVFSVYGYALLDKLPLTKEFTGMLSNGIYPGMITATIGTVLLLAVVATSVVIARRKLRYETWYAVHLLAYAGIALAWFHQIPTGNELVLDRTAADYWRALYVVALALLVVFRILVPVARALRFRLRVVDVVNEAPGVTSLRIAGRGLERLRAQPGQFFLWRFLSHGRWWSAHPFSLSEAPDGRSFRITVKDLGDFSGRAGEIAPGTRVVAEGPFGTFTEAVRTRAKVALIAGGIGITPVRALAQTMKGDVVVLYRVLRNEDAVLKDELDELGVDVRVIAGDHATVAGARLLSPEHLHELVPDISEREVYVCGPPAMTDAIERTVRHAGIPRHHIHIERFAF
ncbi:MAG: ferredoxin reductase family protein [Gaiellaceae bacterium]